MTVVVGTAGHVDHGKTLLLRALTGIDADRLPEERRRGMTIDVGYAWMRLPDGGVLDFVDVPGHERLVGNMLVGAGEVDAALVVVAADEGPRPQTIEHLELLDALGLAHGIVAISKCDLVDPAQAAVTAAEVTNLLGGTSLAGSPVVRVSAVTGAGLDDLRASLVDLRDRVIADGRAFAAGPARLRVDRVFSVRGRGTVVTGTLRGGPIGEGSTLAIVPGGPSVRAREIQVHGSRVTSAGPGGRVAANVASASRFTVSRGKVLAADPRIIASARLLVALEPARRIADGTGTRRPLPAAGTAVRLHLGTATVDGVVRRSRRDAGGPPGSWTTAILRLVEPVAVATGDRFVLRRPSPAEPLAGGRVLDPQPPTGAPWRRATREQVAALALASTSAERVTAMLALHGAIAREDPAAGDLAAGAAVPAGRFLLGPALAATTLEHAMAAVRETAAGLPAPELRLDLATMIRRGASLSRAEAAEAAASLVDGLVAIGRLARSGDLVHLPGRAVGLPPEVLAAMDRLVGLLDADGPPALSAAARQAGCPPAGVRALEAAGRIVRVEADLAWAEAAYRRLARVALRLAAGAPVTPAALRDATGTSRKYVMALLEDLDRRAILARTPDGHVRGPRVATLDADVAGPGSPTPVVGG